MVISMEILRFRFHTIAPAAREPNFLIWNFQFARKLFLAAFLDCD